MFTLWPEQDGWKHLPKHQMQIYNGILEACLLHVLHELCGGQIKGSQSPAISCWQTDILSQGEIFDCMLILMMKEKNEIK